MKKILVLGSNGQLGSDIKTTYKDSDYELIYLTRDAINAETDSVSEKLAKYAGANYLINCISYHKTDECENYPDKSFKINSSFVYDLANYCNENSTTLFHISTDYVFSGDKGKSYTETDTPAPKNVYGISKAAGEMAVKNYAQKYFIFRVSSLFGVAGASGKGGNFVETMIRLAKEGKDLKVVDDQIMAPTHTLDIARSIKALMDKNITDYGIYHCANTGSTSWHSFAKEIFSQAGIDAKLAPTTSSEYKTPAKRPQHSVLDNSKLNAVFSLPKWQDALSEYLKLKGHVN